jgi:hypothetical protein
MRACLLTRIDVAWEARALTKLLCRCRTDSCREQVAAGKGTARARSLFLLYVEVCSISSARLSKGTVKNSKQVLHPYAELCYAVLCV